MLDQAIMRNRIIEHPRKRSQKFPFARRQMDVCSISHHAPSGKVNSQRACLNERNGLSLAHVLFTLKD
jgi:hypothetical protein